MKLRRSTFNSLSRDHLEVILQAYNLDGDPFNSLSRDHGYRLDVGFYEILLELSTPSLGITSIVARVLIEPWDFFFQLPLSGSPAESYEG